MNVRLDSQMVKDPITLAMQRNVDNPVANTAKAGVVQAEVTRVEQPKGQGDKAVDRALVAAINPSDAYINNPVNAGFWSTTTNRILKGGPYSRNDRYNQVPTNPDAISQILSGNEGGQLAQQLTSVAPKQVNPTEQNLLPRYIQQQQKEALVGMQSSGFAPVTDLEDDYYPLQTAKADVGESEEVLPYTIQGGKVTRPTQKQAGGSFDFIA